MIGTIAGWLRAHPRTVDTGLAVLLFGYSLLAVPPGTAASLAALASAAMCVPIALRRTWPVAMSAVVVGTVLVQLGLGIEGLPADAALLVATYTVAAHRSLPSALCAGSAAAACWILGRYCWTYFDTIDLGYLLVATAVALVLGALVRDNALRREREREHQAQITAAAERARIARDLHDIVSHGLGVVVVLAGGAAATARSDPGRAEDAMRTVESTGRTALADMRRMLGVLRGGDRSEHPGAEQVDQLVADARATGAPVRLSVEGTARPLPPAVDLAVYRTVQEGLTNARRHGGPELTRIDVALCHGADAVIVTVRDDGAGTTSTEPGHGLTGMRERVTGCGGRLQAGPGENGGFVVSATIPM